jgi:hypothetical protein
VCISGGITQCLKVAGLAAAFNTTIENGGAWPFHNMHLHAGLAHGGMVEYHYLAVELCRQLYKGLPTPEAGWLTLPRRQASASSRTATRSAEIAKLPLSPATQRGDGTSGALPRAISAAGRLETTTAKAASQGRTS